MIGLLNRHFKWIEDYLGLESVNKSCTQITNRARKALTNRNLDQWYESQLVDAKKHDGKHFL